MLNVQCVSLRHQHESVIATQTDARHSQTAHHRKREEKSTLHADLDFHKAPWTRGPSPFAPTFQSPVNRVQDVIFLAPLAPILSFPAIVGRDGADRVIKKSGKNIYDRAIKYTLALHSHHKTASQINHSAGAGAVL